MLVDMAAVASVSREARGVWSIPCSATRIALLGKSPRRPGPCELLSRGARSACPTRFFTSRTEALDWLGADG